LTAAHTEAQVDDLNRVLTELARDGALRPAIPHQRGPVG
jgi:hypothetical protein